MEKIYINDDCTLKFEVSGVSYLSEDALKKVKSLRLNDTVLLKSDPDNKFDSDAVSVQTEDGTSIGYVNSDALETIHLLLKSGTKYRCSIDRITEHDIPYIWVFIKYEDLDVEVEENDFGEDLSLVDDIYDIDSDDPDFFIIDSIREEDDDAMLNLSTMFLLDEVSCDEDIKDWYNETILEREYKVKYLRKRVKVKAEKEGYKF